MEVNSISSPDKDWKDFLKSENTYFAARQKFAQNANINKMSLVRAALHKATERGCALRYLISVGDIDCNYLLNELLEIASLSSPNIQMARDLILRVDKNIVINGIELKLNDAFLSNDDEVIRRLAELSILIDMNLFKNLVSRALENSNSDIKEIGEDFQSRIS